MTVPERGLAVAQAVTQLRRQHRGEHPRRDGGIGTGDDGGRRRLSLHTVEFVTRMFMLVPPFRAHVSSPQPTVPMLTGRPIADRLAGRHC